MDLIRGVDVFGKRLFLSSALALLSFAVCTAGAPIVGHASTLPKITSLSPNSGASAGGTSIVVTGSGFTGATILAFGTTNVTNNTTSSCPGQPAGCFIVTSDLQINATTPAHQSDVVHVRVTTPNGTSVSSSGNLFTFCCAPNPPTNVIATSTAPGQATVSWTAPVGGGTVDHYVVTTYNKLRNFVSSTQVSAPTTMATVTGLSNGTPYFFTVVSANAIESSAAVETYSVTPLAGTTPPSVSTVVSTKQYVLPNSDGSTWQVLDEAGLALRMSPGSAEDVLLSVNTDLWTWNAGFNQDIGITVNGSLAAWKESGGFAGTFSPNAAFVETVYHMLSGTNYDVRVVWKSNKPAIEGSISAAAGSPGNFSPTRLVAKVLPAGFHTASSTQQYFLQNSDGATWQPVDGTNLSTTFTTTTAEDVVISGNADLWTWNAGFNQDIGITVNGPLVAWKESGGFAGTFSPNAAFVQTVTHLNASTAYTIQLVWKTNKPASGAQISIGAGAGSPFSPTRLTIYPLPGDATLWASSASSSQYTLASSDGSTWMQMDGTNLIATLSPSASESVLVSGNADLWTSNAGFNQDIALFVTDNGGAPQLLAWKESGGFGGTFSPNAAFVQTSFAASSGHTYIFSLRWKTNKPASGATIWAGAGPISGQFSPTRISMFPA